MERKELRALVLDILCTIAPEVEVDTLSDERPLREQIDLDSMDWLNFIISLHERLQLDIPEADYHALGSLNAMLDYLSARQAGVAVAPLPPCGRL